MLANVKGTMRATADKFKILDSVICPDIIPVVDEVAGRDRAMMSCPKKSVLVSLLRYVDVAVLHSGGFALDVIGEVARATPPATGRRGSPPAIFTGGRLGSMIGSGMGVVRLAVSGAPFSSILGGVLSWHRYMIPRWTRFYKERAEAF